MVTIDDILATFFSLDTLGDLGECAYQRLLYTLGVIVPCMYIGFGMVLSIMLVYGIYKLVVGK